MQKHSSNAINRLDPATESLDATSSFTRALMYSSELALEPV
jgi:hypothetical protein